MRTIGGAHACKSYRLVVLLLLCAIIATVQYSRHTRTQTSAPTARPQNVIYELVGEVKKPGIYRFAEEQTPAALAIVCGAGNEPTSEADQTITGGSRLMFNGTGITTTRINAVVLLSYHQPISLEAATAEDLELIPGIGPKTARSLIEYRERTGPVQRIEQIIEVRGIGPKTLKKFTRYLKP